MKFTGELMKFYFESYGCTMNQGESKIMQDILVDRGHEITFDESQSDVLVLVTCTVIETTERKMWKRLRAFTDSGKLVVVAGCMTTVQFNEILRNSPDALILAPQLLKDIGKVADLLSQGEITPETSDVTSSDKKRSAEAIIPVSTGCLGICTYCITRLARGSLKSFNEDMVIKSIKNVVADGYKEIRLSSQDTAAYGVDINSNLADLLKKIVGLEGEFRVRVGMMNPQNALPILDDLIDAYKNDKIFKFLHIPVQSGSEKVLNRMGRNYSTSDFFHVVGRFREAIPNITISTDLIVGFPGEDDSDFDESVKLVKELKPNILNITRFSPRPNTEAIKMDNQIPSRIAKDRSRELTKLHFEISRKINETLVGDKSRILITEHGKNGTLMGRTDSYLPVIMEDNVDICDFVDVKITEAKDTYLKGKVLN
jgi:MiaB-like tRNA modifying enzyme